ncbi:cytochrome c biogenesis protein CcsA [Acidimicrobiaceae bacterium]|jgi:cytochrome c-type biogenesis protein CcmF|nr:cytochrome c biogenesis protein CcsA [Acidimicrobiaceae bacterium]MEC8329172.1 cytochrome c biogenesis protein CcsA [Actinomycetota bacterium]MED5382696.1 cytochrome c biogenesis protein CcsA [Actinomycetota bacterium]|tara:strand:- start:159 stop:2042 length:1884 start_codon:yes stop_codon:yes gene_type:complete
MISSIGIILTWFGFLNLILMCFSNKKNLFQTLVRINLFIHFLLFCLLEVGLFLDDFSLYYIANHSASSTPPMYKFASLWGSLDGSILLWNLVLSIYFYVYVKFYRASTELYDIKIFAMIILFFNGFTIFSSSPFSGCIQLASIGCQDFTLLPFQDLVLSEFGRGPNPLLQNHPLMAIHPPILYFGYIGLVLPFVIATSELFNRYKDENWIKIAEKATYFPWVFLTAGISLGAAWSYEVLGWGGYWAWDPVENVSFIPWLLATAFLHSSKTQIKEKTLINWNYVLACLMFISVIFGTFITRSGVLISVHAFSNGNIGTYLLIGLLIFTFLFMYIGIKNIEYFKTSRKVENIFGRSGFFVANNIILSASALIVLIGTIYPIFYESFFSRQLTVGRSFYDILVGPLLLILVYLMVFSTKIAKVNMNLKKWIIENQNELNISLIISIFLTIYYRASYKFVLTIFGSVLLIIIIGKNVISKYKKTKLQGSYWTGQISHLGIGIFAIGLVLNVTQSFSNELIISTGDTVNFGEKEFIILSPYEEIKEEKNVINLPIKFNNKEKNASLNIFKNSSQQAISSPAVFRNIQSDTYITIKVIDDDKFKLIFRENYGIFILWLGLAISSSSFLTRVRK